MQNLWALAAILAAVLAGMAVGATLTRKPATQPKTGQKTTTTKLAVWVCLGNGIAWVWCSYLLAYLGRDEIAESLSKVAITEIIGVVAVYAVKATLENLSKNNAWPDKPSGTKNMKQDCD